MKSRYQYARLAKRVLYLTSVVALAGLAALFNFGMDALGITLSAVLVVLVAAVTFFFMKFGGLFR